MLFRFKHIWVISLLTLLPLNLSQASERAEQAWKRIERGAIIIDVRTENEFHQGHLSSAINIPLSILPSKANQFDKQQNVVLYCRSGARAKQALKILQGHGCQQVINGGGYEELMTCKKD